MLGASHAQMPTLPQLPTLSGSNWLEGKSEKGMSQGSMEGASAACCQDAGAPSRSLSLVSCLSCHSITTCHSPPCSFGISRSFSDKVWWTRELARTRFMDVREH